MLTGLLTVHVHLKLYPQGVLHLTRKGKFGTWDVSGHAVSGHAHLGLLLDDLSQSIYNDKTNNFFEVSKGSAGKLKEDIPL